MKLLKPTSNEAILTNYMRKLVKRKFVIVNQNFDALVNIFLVKLTSNRL